MASQVQIIQGKNSFLDALQASLTNVGAAAAQGMLDREKRIQASNVENANLLGKKIEALSTQYGGWAFDPRSADAIADPTAREVARAQINDNLATLNTYIQTRQKALGAPMSPEEQASLRSLMMMPATPLQQKAYFDTFNLNAMAPQASAPAPAVKPTTPVGKVAPAATAAAQGQGMPSQVASKIQGPRPTNEQLRYGFRDIMMQSPPYDPTGMSPVTDRTVLNDAIKSVLMQPQYAQNPQVQNVLRQQYMSGPEGAIFASNALADLVANDPVLEGELLSALQQQKKLQGGVQANGTVSLAAHERRTGDEHYPARVGVKELIVNARAAEQPGVAQMIMDLNRRFPANVAASRGTYADGDLALDTTGETRYVPSSAQAYQQAVGALGGAVADTQAQALSQRQAMAAAQGPAYMNAPTPGVTPQQPVPQGIAYGGASTPQQYMSTAPASDKTPLSILEQKGVLTPAPTPSEKSQIAWDQVRKHAADVQAKYQINFANPDPREQAILAKELAVENNMVKRAIAQDTNRKTWLKDQQQRLETYLRTASDEDIALTFGDAVAQARDRSKTRDLKAAELQIMREQMKATKDTEDKFMGTLALQSMTAASNVVKEFVGKDKEGKATFNEEAFNKASANVPWIKSSLDIANAIQGVRVPGVAEPTMTEKAKFLFFGGGYKWGFDTSGLAQEQAAAAVAPKTSTQSAADAAMKGSDW